MGFLWWVGESGEEGASGRELLVEHLGQRAAGGVLDQLDERGVEQGEQHVEEEAGPAGGVAGAIISTIVAGRSLDPHGLIGATYGAATGIAFVVLHYLTSARPARTPQYEAIFE